MVLNLLYELCSVSFGEVLFAPMTLIDVTIKFSASTTFQFDILWAKFSFDYSIHVRRSSARLRVSVRH